MRARSAGAPGAAGTPPTARVPPPAGPAPPPPPPPSRPGAGAATRRDADLGLLPWLYAAGAVFFLVWATQALALLLAPAGRSQLVTEMGRQGVPADARTTAYLAPAQWDDKQSAPSLASKRTA